MVMLNILIGQVVIGYLVLICILYIHIKVIYQSYKKADYYILFVTSKIRLNYYIK